jgi:8-oxo-dGTP pyrophosphatase MutT (NUDIX family)
MTRIKKSYGVICMRTTAQGMQLLMVKRATTYHFSEFVSGHYNKANETHLMTLFNNMTFDEKRTILTLKYDAIWYKAYLELVDSHYFDTSAFANQYIQRKNKFENTFLRDGGTRLRNLISKSRNSDMPWTIPKGRKDSDREADLDTAIREFREETGIEDAYYKVLWNIPPYIETYSDFGITYQNTYYYAEAVGTWDPVYRFGNKKLLSEIADIKWLSKESLPHMNLDATTFKRMKKSFDKMIKKYKNNYYTNSIKKEPSTVAIDYLSAIKSIANLKPVPSY